MNDELVEVLCSGDLVYAMNSRLPSFHSDIEFLIDSVVASSAVRSPRWYSAQRIRLPLFFAGVILCFLAAAAYHVWVVAPIQEPTSMPNAAEVSTSLVVATAALFGYRQWLDAREETSTDRFYDRLKLVNDVLIEWPQARAIAGQHWINPRHADDYRPSMFAYLELDNLEYMLVRFTRGYADHQLLRRAIRTFATRCESEQFRQIVSEIVKGPNYLDETKDVAGLVIGKWPTAVSAVDA